MDSEKLNKEKPLYVIVLGSGYSGSGAVFDYLAGREDVCDPLDGSEFYIVQNPYGILNFFSTVYGSYYPVIGAEALNQLERFLKRAGYPERGLKCGYGLDGIFNDYQGKVDRYISKLTEASFPFVNQFFLLKKNYYQTFKAFFKKSITDFHVKNKKFNSKIHEYLYCLLVFLASSCCLLIPRPQKSGICGRVLGRLKPVTEQRVPVPRDTFIKATQNFLSELFNDMIKRDTKPSTILLNQAGSYWCPEKSAAFFESARIITVSRDPRDQFAELKLHKSLTDVDDFVKWYRSIMKLRSRQNCSSLKSVLDIQFEKFVNNYDKEKDKLCSFLNIDKTIPSPYQPSLSKKNIMKYKAILSTDEVRYIEKELSDFLH